MLAHLEHALDQIAEIHGQMARTRIFRGFRAATTLITGLAAIAAAFIQSQTITNPAADPWRIVDLWGCVAVGSVLLVGAEITLRYHRTVSPLQRDLAMQFVEHFLPCLVLGALVTAALCFWRQPPIGILPGLWSIFFAMGIFSARRLLPTPIIWIAIYYAITGLVLLAQSGGQPAFSPWAMAIPFGIGQITASIILYWTLERNHPERKNPE